MSITQDIARNLLSDRLFASLRTESERWAMRCPCGAETSIWEMGGIRWKAHGEPRRMGFCGTCQRNFWGQLYRRSHSLPLTPRDGRVPSRPQPAVRERVSISQPCLQETTLAHADQSRGTERNAYNHTMNTPAAPVELDRTAAVLLWIDGVGCWILFPGDQVTIGGPVEPGSSQPAADLCVLANLRRLHATLERTGETWQLTSVDHDETSWLRDGSEITPGSRLSLMFRTPSVLSPTATLTPASEPWPRMFTGGRTPATIDGVVLMDEVCLLGPGTDAHIQCRDWEQPVILFRRDGQLWIRSQSSIEINGQTVEGPRAIDDGAVISGEHWRFRIEAVPRANGAAA